MPESTVRVLFTGEAGGALRSVKQLEGGFAGLGRGAKLAGAAIGAGIVGGLIAASKAAITFDREMRNVNSLTKLSEKNFKAMEKQVLSLAKTTGKMPADLAKGLYDIVSSGFKANDAIKILNVSAKAATAGMTTTAISAKAVNAALNAYHLSADQARKVSDVLFQTVNKGVLTFEELAQNMGDLVPAAAPLGVKLEEVGAAIATITLQGVPASEAATRVKNTMLQLASPSENLSKLLRANGFATGEAAIASKGFVGVLDLVNKATGGNVTQTSKLIPEIRALMGVVGLTGKNVGLYKDNLAAMNDASKGAGATAAAFAEQGRSISVQWDKAKASLVAAAIPVGELLFPLFREAAEGVGDFAQAVQAKMPEIRAQFGQLAGGARDVGSALADVGRSREGQIAIAGIASGLAGGAATGRIVGLVAALRSIHPAVGIVVGAFALLGAGAYAAMTQVGGLERRLNDVREAMTRHHQAARNVRDAQLEVRVSTTQLEVAQRRLGDAHRESQRTLRESGAASKQHRDALLVERIESDNVALANQRLQRAKEKLAVRNQQNAAAERDQAAAIAKSHEAITGATRQFNVAEKAVVAARTGTAEYTAAIQRNYEAMRSRAISAYATEVRNLEKLLGGAAISAGDAETAVRSLAAALGRLPTQREIRIYVRTLRSESVVGAIARQEAHRRAGGGFIPLSAGIAGRDSVPALLTPGEVVLNREQQNMLGGPSVLARIFGFTGREGPGFATGGIVGAGPVGGGGGRRSKRSPHRPRHTRTLPSSKAARAVLGALADVDIREADLDRVYGQLARQFDLTSETFLVGQTELDPETGEEISFEVVDQAAVAQRVGEIDQLVQHRQRMLALLDEEKRELAAAVKALKEAIDRLRKAIREQVAAAKEEHRQANELARRIEAEKTSADRQVAAERKRKKPDEKRITRIEAASTATIGRLTRQKGTHDTYAARHEEQAQTLSHQLGEFEGALNDRDTGVLRNQRVIVMDRGDVQLDIAQLQAERRDVLATAAQPRRPRTTPSPGGDSAGGFGGGSGEETAGVGIVAGVDTALLESLRAEIARLRLALGIEAVQLPILDSFQRGTVHVPMTGAYELHAGEQVIPRGERMGGFDGSGGASPPVVNVYVDDAMSWLKPYIRSEVMGSYDDVAVKAGREADRRRREGRY